jgi:uncharacterized membrane protein YiaA
MAALILRFALGAWLFASAFFMPQSTATAWNAIVVGVLVCAVALFAATDPRRTKARYALWVLSIWLFATAILMPHEAMGTVFHDVIVAVLIAAVSLWAPRAGPAAGKPAG